MKLWRKTPQVPDTHPQPDLSLVPDDPFANLVGEEWLDMHFRDWRTNPAFGSHPTISLGGLEEEFREPPAPPEGGPMGGWQASLAAGLEGMAAEAMQPVVKPAKRFAVLQVIQTIAQVVIAFGVIAILVVML